MSFVFFLLVPLKSLRVCWFFVLLLFESLCDFCNEEEKKHQAKEKNALINTLY